jgi:hypothetical protein
MGKGNEDKAGNVNVNRPSMTFNTTTAGEDRYKLGTRLTANPKPFDFDLEPDYQFGRSLRSR